MITSTETEREEEGGPSRWPVSWFEMTLESGLNVIGAQDGSLTFSGSGITIDLHLVAVTANSESLGFHASDSTYVVVSMTETEQNQLLRRLPPTTTVHYFSPFARQSSTLEEWLAKSHGQVSFGPSVWVQENDLPLIKTLVK
ncbi:hypothetical protein ACFQ4M_17325 [Thauera mechernichensis]|uniref:Uncharacterized protein n=1 Tax=Thauera mechernichensis TaxID=82788 RepID=A0ABW3WHJ6_9RHOO|nr:hypothetical protein [Thauera mechernichensis]MDG3065997.1 hypothetical protein [Thauera mechernichensis]